MIRQLKVALDRWFPRYKQLECAAFTYEAADKVLRQSPFQVEADQWRICEELEDVNRTIGIVYLERRVKVPR